MDHWGDPWADNASHKSPTKNAVASPLPPAFAFAPVPLNGFVDDAGWGNNDDDGFGGWATSPRIGSGNAVLTGVEPPQTRDQASDSARWGSSSFQRKGDLDEVWPEALFNTVQDFEHVDSEPSDSATVSQLDDIADKDAAEKLTPQSQPDGGSRRSSTSPSETSRNELPIESPRTSIEEERSISKDNVPQNEVLVSTIEQDAITADAISKIQTKAEGNVNVPEDKEDMEKPAPDTGDTKDLSPSPPGDSCEPDISKEPSATPSDATVGLPVPSTRPIAFACDEAVMAQLFPPSGGSAEQLDAHDSPIYSTPARKAWYRLTRKQTMREFNHGDDDDNYIRVTWTNSHVRAEVNKVVGRWAREDRISGTGPGARASFYWDTAAPPEPKAPFGHLRTQSSIPSTKAALPARQSLPPLATDKPAAFDWSSPTSADPWKLDSPAQHSKTTPLALKNPAVAKIQRQEGRAVSVDLTPRKSEQWMHKRTATVSHTTPETTAVANLASKPISQLSAGTSDPWTNVSSLDNSSTSTPEAADSSFDDDDDWGDMVQTPTLPTSSQLDPFPQPASSEAEHPQPTSSIKPNLQQVRPAQPEPAESMFASPIVRLQSTISPTSALFQAKSFVPLHAEHGPIGPGILKPANRSIKSIPDKKLKEEPVLSISDEAGADAVATIDAKGARNEEDIVSAIPRPASLSRDIAEVQAANLADQNFIPIAPPATPTQASNDPWADADFSFFESSLPVAASQPIAQLEEPYGISVLSGPTSSSGTPDPTSLSQSPQFSLRSPPRDLTPPVLQPLSAATNSLQRRKADEDQAITDILAGLPDLTYMLR